jgi:hypothetical protein
MARTKNTRSSKSNGKDKKTTWSSKSNGKDKILPDLARATARTKYYLV